MENTITSGTETLKLCVDCKIEKTVSEFNRNRKAKDGLQVRCKLCNRRVVLEWQKKFPERVNLKNSLWKTKQPDYWRDYGKHHWANVPYEKKLDIWRRQDLRRKYGITPETYDQMLTSQGGICAICGGVPEEGRQLAVDHSHANGALRGLLCSQCNVLLHKLETISGWISSAEKYIEKYLGAEPRPKFVGSRERVRKKVCVSPKNELSITIAPKS